MHDPPRVGLVLSHTPHASSSHSSRPPGLQPVLDRLGTPNGGTPPTPVSSHARLAARPACLIPHLIPRATPSSQTAVLLSYKGSLCVRGGQVFDSGKLEEHVPARTPLFRLSSPSSCRSFSREMPCHDTSILAHRPCLIARFFQAEEGGRWAQDGWMSRKRGAASGRGARRIRGRAVKREQQEGNRNESRGSGGGQTRSRASPAATAIHTASAWSLVSFLQLIDSSLDMLARDSAPMIDGAGVLRRRSGGERRRSGERRAKNRARIRALPCREARRQLIRERLRRLTLFHPTPFGFLVRPRPRLRSHAECFISFRGTWDSMNAPLYSTSAASVSRLSPLELHQPHFSALERSGEDEDGAGLRSCLVYVGDAPPVWRSGARGRVRVPHVFAHIDILLVSSLSFSSFLSLPSLRRFRGWMKG
ncbi:hypothetical protein DFH07DRAFT_1055289 [Mycena maculata]|uniref:Uncharacterized protein n=1 Tax=Mycena maculata TaxID=230809 RepID=A0AAD7KBR3_9AGAR|nr:hypothetical protein DFH07DRAFT_1055289 [Mycena maculata]